MTEQEEESQMSPWVPFNASLLNTQSHIGLYITLKCLGGLLVSLWRWSGHYCSGFISSFKLL